MSNNNGGGKIIALGITAVMIASMIMGYKTVTWMSPKVDERFKEITKDLTGRVEETTGVDLEEMGVVQLDDKPAEPVDELEEKEIPAMAVVNSGLEYTYKDQNTRNYTGPRIYQAKGYIYNTEGKVITDFRSEKTYTLDLYKNVDGSEAVLVHDRKCYYVDADLNLKEIADNVKTAGICYEGGYFYYVKEEADSSRTLYIYSVEAGREWEVSKGYSIFVVMSPNGRCVAAFDYRSQRELHIAGLDMDEIIVPLDKRSVPMAVSNDGDTVFYYSADDVDGIFCYHENKTTKISKEYPSQVVFDRDCKQIIFNEPNALKYYRAGDASAAFLGNGNMFDIVVNGVSTQQVSPFYHHYIADTDSFADAVMIKDGRKAYCLKGEIPELVDMAEGIGNPYNFTLCVTPQGPACIYINEGHVVKAVYDGEEFTREKVFTTGDGQFSAYTCSPDLSKIWGLVGNSIYYAGAGQEPVLVAEHHNKINRELCYSIFGERCYYIAEGELYCVGEDKASKTFITSGCESFRYITGEVRVPGFRDEDSKEFIVLKDQVLDY